MSELPPSGRPVPVRRADEPAHRLASAATIRALAIGGAVLLAVITLLDLVVAKHGYFALEETFGFGSWYGFAACVVLVVLSKALGGALKRGDSYYDD